MKLLHTQVCPTATREQVHNLQNQRVIIPAPRLRKEDPGVGADRFQRCGTAAPSPMTTMRSITIGKRSELILLAAVQGTAVSVLWTVVALSPMTTVRSFIAGRRWERILLGVQGTVVSTDVPWTTVVALRPMTTMRSSMVGGRSERVLGVGNPAPGTRTGGVRTRDRLGATRRAT